MTSNGIAWYWLSHAALVSHQQRFHNSVDTKNFTTVPSKTIILPFVMTSQSFFFTKIFFQCVLPDQEREYTISTAR